MGKNFYQTHTNMSKYVVVHDSEPDYNSAFPQDWLCQTASKLGQLHLFKMVGTVPGDVLLKVGMTINVEMQNFIPQEDNVELNATRTGRYLISAVHHKFIGDVYTTILELLSDSVNDYMPSPINNSPKLKELISS